MRLPRLSPATKALFLIAASAVSAWANAHTGADAHAYVGFMAGFTHPFFGVDHLAAMVAVGVWSALVARRAGPELLWGPLGFTNMLLLGAMLGLSGYNVPAVEPMIAASLLVIGLLVVSRLQVTGMYAAIVVGVFAVFHGIAHGAELAGSTQAFEVVAGMVLATLMLHGGGLALGWWLRRANVWASRLVGGAVALLGSGFLWQMA